MTTSTSLTAEVTPPGEARAAAAAAAGGDGDGLAGRCRRLAAAPAFGRAVVALIVLNAALLGLETSRGLTARFGGLFMALNWALQAFFVAEIAVRVAAHGRRPGAFFRDGWNVFDFAIVAASLLPASGGFATVGRLLRLLRVARLVSASPQLRLIVSTMLASIPAMGHVVLLLSLLLYVYAVAGVNLFRDADPEAWGTLGAALLSLFQVVTLEGWAELQARVMPAAPWAWLYFGSFIVVGVFVVINLFIAVVINNLESAKEEERAAGGAGAGAGAGDEALARVRAMRREIEALEAALERRGR